MRGRQIQNSRIQNSYIPDEYTNPVQLDKYDEYNLEQIHGLKN